MEIESKKIKIGIKLTQILNKDFKNLVEKFEEYKNLCESNHQLTFGNSIIIAVYCVLLPHLPSTARNTIVKQLQVTLKENRVEHKVNQIIGHLF